MSLDSPKIQKLVNQHDENIKFITKSGKSFIWEHVSVVKYKNELLNFVVCNICKKVMLYDTKAGTTNIARHIKANCQKKCDEKQPSIQGHIVRKLPDTIKQNLNHKAVLCIAKDLRPFSIIDGEGFKVRWFMSKFVN